MEKKHIQRQLNFSTWKPRASRVGDLMYESRSKSKVLGTNRSIYTYLQEEYIKAKYGREKIVNTKEMRKGIEMEGESIGVLNNMRGTFYSKNKKNFSNEYITGTPDIVTDDAIIDIKTSFDIFTFTAQTGKNKLYYWQLQAYMWLTGKQRAELAYILCNTPEYIIYSEFYKALYFAGVEHGSEEYDLLENQVRHNHTYDDMPLEDRVKVFQFERNDEDIEKIKRHIEASREYLKSL